MYIALIVVLSILPTLIVFLAVRLEPRTDATSPLKVLGWTLLLGYTPKSLYIAYALSAGLPFRSEHISRDIIHVGQLAILLGTFAFIIGYVWYQSMARHRTSLIAIPARAMIDPRLIYVPFLVVSAGLMAAYFVKMGFYDQLVTGSFSAARVFISERSGASSALGFLLIGGDFIVVIAIYHYIFTRRWQFLNVYTGLLIFTGLCYFLSSHRSGVLIMVILFFLIIGIRGIQFRKALKPKHFVMLGVAVALLSFASQIREGQRRGAIYQQLSLATSIEVSFQHAMQGAYFLDPAKTAAIIDQVSEKEEYLNGQSYALFLFAPIPRLLWPDKPSIRLGPYVAQDLLELGTNSGIPPSSIGEFYMNFGWLGVVLGMALLGAFAGRVWDRARRAEDRRFARGPFALNMMCIILLLVGDFSHTMLTLIKYQIAIWICERYWRRKIDPPTSAVGAAPDLVPKAMPG